MHTPGVMGGDRTTATRGTESSALADELFALLPIALPDVELPGEGDLEAAGDLAAALLGTGRARADILPQAGSQLSVVAALVAGDEGAEEGPALGRADLDELFLHPLEQAQGTPTGAGDEAVALADTAATDEAQRPASFKPRFLSGTFATLASLAGLLLRPRRRTRRTTARPALRQETPKRP
jgi:hypothetical protein